MILIGIIHIITTSVALRLMYMYTYINIYIYINMYTQTNQTKMHKGRMHMVVCHSIVYIGLCFDVPLDCLPISLSQNMLGQQPQLKN